MNFYPQRDLSPPPIHQAVKRRDVEIIQKDGKFLVLKARERMPISLSQIAKEVDYRMSSLCDRIGISERHMRRVFGESVGIPPKEWLRKERMADARSLLCEGSPIKEVAMDLGFTTPKMFSREFQLFYGMKPTDYQRREFTHILDAAV